MLVFCFCRTWIQGCCCSCMMPSSDSKGTVKYGLPPAQDAADLQTNAHAIILSAQDFV